MHRKSLEAAHQLTSGDESNKDDNDDDDDPTVGGVEGGDAGVDCSHSSGDENTIGDPKDQLMSPLRDAKKNPAASVNHPLLQPLQQNQHHHLAPSSQSEAHYTASYQINGRSIEDFRMNSVAELRAKAAEHQARVALNQVPLQVHSIQQHHQQQSQQQQQARILHPQPQPQRDGEFLVSSDSSSSPF